jgi:hypothetical protein
MPDSTLISRLVLKESGSPLAHDSTPFHGSISLMNRFQNALKPIQYPVRKEVIEDGFTFKDAETV